MTGDAIDGIDVMKIQIQPMVMFSAGKLLVNCNLLPIIH